MPVLQAMWFLIVHQKIAQLGIYNVVDLHLCNATNYWFWFGCLLLTFFVCMIPEILQNCRLIEN